MKTNGRLYIAYGSNLNREQMKRRCPTAEIVGQTMLRNWRLKFRGSTHNAVATIEQNKGSQVPVIIWRIQPSDEATLDRYEGCPHLYRKEFLRIALNGKRIGVMVYIMNETGHPYGTPSDYYLDTIREGYKSAGFDLNILNEAVKSSKSNDRMSETVKTQILAIRDSGETNMLDTRMVQFIADRMGFYELVIYLEEHKKEYVDFILYGSSGSEE